MEKQFVTYEIALKLKELGFDEPCLGFFDMNKKLILGVKPEYLESTEKANYIFGNAKIKVILAPLWQQAWKFILAKLYLSSIEIYDDDSCTLHVLENDENNSYHSQEEAMLKAIELC